MEQIPPLSPFWREYHEFFDSNDGSLPEVRFTDVSDANLPHLFEHLQHHASTMSPAGFWDPRNQRDVAVADVPNAAALVAAGTVEPFRIMLSGVQVRGTRIPDIGVFVLRGEVALDYQPGAEWNESRFRALLDLICALRTIAPEASVSTEPFVVEEYRLAFEREVIRHCSSRSASNDR